MYQILIDGEYFESAENEAHARSIARRFAARGYENVEIIPPQDD